jgi:hypothetical protein
MAKLTDLHTFAQTLACDDVSPVLIEHGGLIVDGDRLNALRFWAEIIAEPWDEDVPQLTGDPDSAMGFFMNPGRGCETAHVGFLRRADTSGAPADWFWRCSCKTQYASIVSNEHLVACHTALVRLLDHAITLAINVDVYDETHYWETRDTSRLVDEVHKMNQIVARFAGRLSDELGEGKDVQASIFEHPRFERLEMGEGE